MDVARSFRERLLGLSFRDLPTLPPGYALLFPRTCSVHTFGMRFALDLCWLGPGGETVRIDRAVPPRRIRTCLKARSVIEAPAGGDTAVLRWTDDPGDRQTA